MTQEVEEWWMVLGMVEQGLAVLQLLHSIVAAAFVSVEQNLETLSSKMMKSTLKPTSKTKEKQTEKQRT